MLKVGACASFIVLAIAVCIVAATRERARWEPRSEGRVVEGACVPRHSFAGPALGGPYCVGVQTRLLVDASRDEILTTTPGDLREIQVEIFYPIMPGSDASPARYGDPETWDPLLISLLYPKEVFSRSVVGEAVALEQGGFPLILYSPAFALGVAGTNTLLIEDLVSHGYVVAAIDHPYISYGVKLRNGRIARWKQDVVATAEAPDFDEEVHAFPIAVEDARFVLRYMLELGRREPAWAGRIRPTAAGMFGHSYGGAIAAEVVRSEDEVVAGIDYDGRFHGAVLDQGIGEPFLIIALEGRLNAIASRESFRRGFESSRPGYYVEIAGGVHSMFAADLGLVSELQSGVEERRLTGDLDPRLLLEICSAYNRAFFDAYLKGKPTDPLLALAGPYEMLRFETTGETPS